MCPRVISRPDDRYIILDNPCAATSQIPHIYTGFTGCFQLWGCLQVQTQKGNSHTIGLICSCNFCHTNAFAATKQLNIRDQMIKCFQRLCLTVHLINPIGLDGIVTRVLLLCTDHFFTLEKWI